MALSKELQGVISQMLEPLNGLEFNASNAEMYQDKFVLAKS